MEQRKDARFPVQFRSSFSSANVVSGEGTLSDSSIRGCRVFSLIEIKPGTALQLRVHTSDHDPPIQVSQAVVRWVRSSSFGCEFVNLGAEEWARLRAVTTELEKEPYLKVQAGTDVA